jgi:hypothetical protein
LKRKVIIIHTEIRYDGREGPWRLNLEISFEYKNCPQGKQGTWVKEDSHVWPSDK